MIRSSIGDELSGADANSLIQNRNYDDWENPEENIENCQQREIFYQVINEKKTRTEFDVESIRSLRDDIVPLHQTTRYHYNRSENE